jgi:hypothetical protein
VSWCTCETLTKVCAVGHHAAPQNLNPHQRGMRSWKKLRTIWLDLIPRIHHFSQRCRPRYAHLFCLHAQPRWRMPCTVPSAFINSMLLMLKAHLCIHCSCRNVRHTMHVHNRRAPSTKHTLVSHSMQHRHSKWVALSHSSTDTASGWRRVVGTLALTITTHRFASPSCFISLRTRVRFHTTRSSTNSIDKVNSCGQTATTPLKTRCLGCTQQAHADEQRAVALFTALLPTRCVTSSLTRHNEVPCTRASRHARATM